MIRQDDFQASQLVLAGWQHAHKYGGFLAPCMVMSCLANRQKLGWGSWLEIIESIPKYSATLEQPTGMPQIWSPEFVRLLHECQSIYDGSKDYSNGGLYWLNSAEPITNPWFQDKILNNIDVHPRVADLTSLMIFR